MMKSNLDSNSGDSHFLHLKIYERVIKPLFLYRYSYGETSGLSWRKTVRHIMLMGYILWLFGLPYIIFIFKKRC